MGLIIYDGSFTFNEQLIDFSGFLNISEPNDPASINFSRFGGATGILNIPYTISGTATNGVDYELLSGILTFNANSGSANLPIIIKDDALIEGSETIKLNFPGGITFDLNIIDDDPVTTNNPVITLAVAPATVTEDGNTNLVYTFTRTGATTNALTVNYGVAGTAGLTSDYTQSGAASFSSTAGTVTFAAGATTAKVTINPNADTTVEANETVRLTLASGTGYTVGSSAVATGTITNDDSAVVVKPTINLAVAPATVTEDGSTNLVYTFTRTGATTNALTVNYGVAGTAGLTSDYIQTGAASFNSTAGTVTFAAGATTAKVTINPKADTIVEANETVRLTLTSGAGYTVGSSAVATGTITNDDQPVNTNSNVINPTQNIAGKTQSQLGDEWWRWGLSVTQSDNPITASTGDFAGINQSGDVQFLTGSFAGTANRSVVVSSKKYLFFPIINSATIGNDLPNFDTRQDDFRIWNRDYARQPKTFNLTIDGVSVINPSDALKYLQQNAQNGSGFSSYLSPENNVIIGGGVPDQTNISGNYQKGYFVGLKPLAPGKHTITFDASYLQSTYLTNAQGAFVLDSAGKKILIDAKDENGQPVYNSQKGTYEIEVKSFNEILGNNSNNTIHVTAAHDDIDAFDGRDTVYGYAGDDTIDLGTGDDTAYGGDGNDIIYGGAGEDRFYGDYGDDVLAGGLGDDTITGGYGNDRLYGGAGRDTLTADIGDDIVFGGADNDGIDAGIGNDIIDAVAYSPLVLPVIKIGTNAENNPIFAKAGQGEIDVVKGARGKDTFVLGSAGTPYYVGNGKNDYALIQDFTLVKNDPQNADKIQLYSQNLKSSDYVLGAAPSGTPYGVGIFTNNADRDLIAILQGVNIQDLSLNNSSQFSFVN
jgi:Ca2+-binding RTX toxin-like protein